MKNIFKLTLVTFLFLSCNNKSEISSVGIVNWENRTIKKQPKEVNVNGSTYLSVYSQIYSQTEHRTHNLTATISMRNANRLDTVYINKAEYFNTKGESIRTYFENTIFIAPMETVEIVIDEKDQEGGTGANFLFDWSIKQGVSKPLFEGVMISTSGQQGLSFTTEGRQVK